MHVPKVRSMFYMMLLSWVCCAFVYAQLVGKVTNEVGRIGVDESLDRTVTRVYPDSPAEKAGIQIGDKIYAIDGKIGARGFGEVDTVCRVTVKRKKQYIDFECRRVSLAKFKKVKDVNSVE